IDTENGIITKAVLVLGGVAPVPVCCEEAGAYLVGKEATAETGEEAARIALKDAVPLWKNAYKVDVAASLIKNAVARAAE
ncbi:MAG: hypothetical protein IKF16_05575, partial [Lachnospiraceae bacterium]|nr:hypothetical protein [Lachnospiraceae bacterium]